MAYYVTLAAFFAASFFPEGRVWGINWWAYHPLWLRLALLAVGGIVPIILHLWLRNKADADLEISSRTYWLVTITVSVMLVALFWILRSRTHFLGDGYTLISLMASEQPLVKMRNLGGTILPLLVTNLLGGKTEANVELAYQLVSVGSGVLFLVLAIWSARKLFDNRTTQLLWTGLLITGGYTLQFFGYVENYAVFLVGVALFCIVGMLAAQDRLNRWWIVPASALAVFLHIFGAVFLPAAAYILVRETNISGRFHRMSTASKWLLVFVGALIAAIVFMVEYRSSVYFQTALMPPITNVFTFDGYTLLSRRHILDYSNLLLLLCPGLLVLAVCLPWGSWRKTLKSPVIVFLILGSVGGLTADFIFEPKLGMARDWDLFSYAGIPVVMLLTSFALKLGLRRPLPMILGLPLLAFSTVATRAWVITEPDLGVSQFKTYFALDPIKTRPGLFALRQYYWNIGDSTLAYATDSLRARLFPEENMAKLGQQLFNRGMLAQGKQVLDRAMQTNPTYPDTWLGYALYYIYVRQFDSAKYYLHVADGLNPYSPSVAAEYGRLYYFQGDWKKAEEYWLLATDLNADFDIGLYNLAQLYLGRGDTTKYESFLTQSTERKWATWETAKELADFLAAKGSIEKARQYYALALSKGMDSSKFEMPVSSHRR
ncbi:MAG: hypothetical protein AB1644_11610 [Candidatus Zixiibacteriota bacterium]